MWWCGVAVGETEADCLCAEEGKKREMRGEKRGCVWWWLCVCVIVLFQVGDLGSLFCKRLELSQKRQRVCLCVYFLYICFSSSFWFHLCLLKKTNYYKSTQRSCSLSFFGVLCGVATEVSQTALTIQESRVSLWQPLSLCWLLIDTLIPHISERTSWKHLCALVCAIVWLTGKGDKVSPLSCLPCRPTCLICGNQLVFLV